MGVIELSQKFLQKVREAFNQALFEQENPQRIEIITEAEEKPSPLPRLSKNEAFLDEMNRILERHYGSSALMVGVTDTNSMENLIDNGHTIIILPLNEDEKKKLQVGDIILFNRVADGNPRVLHRIIKKEDNYVVTRGDNLVVNDGIIAYKDINGICVGILY